jgi:mannitol-1-phosphate/altronate dehydrogenase
MLKKTTILLILCFLFSCGYQPLYLKNNDLRDRISSVKLEGDKKINRTIISFLNLKENKDIKIGNELTLASKKKIEVVSKDKAGNPSTFRSTLMVNVSLNDNKDKTIKQKKFSASFSYNTVQNKFELSQYQKNVELNLIDEISEKIFIYLKS